MLLLLHGMIALAQEKKNDDIHAYPYHKTLPATYVLYLIYLSGPIPSLYYINVE